MTAHTDRSTDPSGAPDLPDDYSQLLERLKVEVYAARKRGLASQATSGPALSDLAEPLPAPAPDLVQELDQGPYAFEPFGFNEQVAERDLEQVLMDRLQQFLLERGFALVGRRVHLDVDGDDFYMDLLLFQVQQLRYVVVELRVGNFAPEYVGKLNFFIAAVNDLYRQPQHAPTVGLLVCAGRDERVVRYSLSGGADPIAVAGYTHETLPEVERELLPDAAEALEALTQPLRVGRRPMTVDES